MKIILVYFIILKILLKSYHLSKALYSSADVQTQSMYVHAFYAIIWFILT